MFISKVVLEDYRIYHGVNELEFVPHSDKNIFIISGENGFGKTTFLTSLVWCLYGKLMIDVDDKYRREIYQAGGYKKYASNNLNRRAAFELKDTYSVSIVLTDIFIPSILCKEVAITRTFSYASQDDKVIIYIDGEKNELTKKVGAEIFINDFILPKEVAKFFFFDAEKIVSLAEMQSLDDKRKLSKAYSEVLGIKKYEDLKNNLQDLRIRFRRSSATKKDKEKFENLQSELLKLQGLIDFNQEQLVNLTEEKEIKNKQSEHYQEKLIREGNSLTVEELIDLKKMRDVLSEEGKKIRGKMKELLELAPLAIAGNKFIETRKQIHKEANATLNNLDPSLIKEKINNINSLLKSEILPKLNLETKINNKLLKTLSNVMTDEFLPDKENEFSILLGFTEAERNEFEAIYTNLKYSYSAALKKLIREDKNRRITFNKVIRQISNAESKENDLLVKEIRHEKSVLDNRIVEIDIKTADLHQEIGGWQRDVAVMNRQVAELSKKIKLEKSDLAKDAKAKQLIEELDLFIGNLKQDKKSALEDRIKTELNRLMHKAAFVHRVEVEVSEDIIDIHLYDKRDNRVQKESLSKGEQQLYATSILKSLVDESNFKFPIFIDSPLQKLDKRHSMNIIGEFYPNVSEQVVLFPLLEKELTEIEYQILLPKVNTCYLIVNIDEDCSVFQKIKPKDLFKIYQKHEHVYAH